MTLDDTERKALRSISGRLPRRLRRALTRGAARPVDSSPLLSEQQVLLIAYSLVCFPENVFVFDLWMWGERTQAAAGVEHPRPPTECSTL